MDYKEIKVIFDAERKKEQGSSILEKVTKIICDVGESFLTYNGSELSEMRSKIIGYKYFLSDYLADLERMSESIKMEIKETRAKEYDRIAEEIRARDGKVKNKEQVENTLFALISDKSYEQILYQTMFHCYRMKVSAIDDVITAITQRIADLKRQQEDAKY